MRLARLFLWEVKTGLFELALERLKMLPLDLFHFHCRGEGSASLIALLDFAAWLFFQEQ